MWRRRNPVVANTSVETAAKRPARCPQTCPRRSVEKEVMIAHHLALKPDFLFRASQTLHSFFNNTQSHQNSWL
ncbi:hypothetical protein EYF80_004885 [Liparis tanakae]|uniref:Uncharacterized protein n=1 Tax=Liparis tanakae TaxID=230148 RepID=A0A4Z2J3S4_9TELE|nr:hypothetical protein EYF80_004885 [Liparis tanakae]